MADKSRRKIKKEKPILKNELIKIPKVKPETKM